MNTLVSNFVALPDELKASLIGLVVALFALGFNWLIARFPFLAWFRQYQQEWALAAAVALIKAIEAYTPDLYGQVVITGLNFVFAVIALFVVYIGGQRLLKGRGVAGFR